GSARHRSPEETRRRRIKLGAAAVALAAAAGVGGWFAVSSHEAKDAPPGVHHPDSPPPGPLP
ncbi:serine/threonine protein kinase, partial [Streptomyces sp. NPDC020667]